jgi:hypothetical protein
VPLAVAILLVMVQSLTRRTAALVAVSLSVLGPAAAAQTAPRPRTPARRAWEAGDAQGAARAARVEAVARGDDTAWYNAGTAALAAGDDEAARAALARAAAALDPDVRFRALFNLGVLALRQAGADSARRETHLAEAERANREALLLRPADGAAKWNLELAVRERRGGGGGGGGGAPNDPTGGGGAADPREGQDDPPPRPPSGLSRSQAEQILQSIGQEELRARRERAGGTRRATPPRVKDW